MTDSIAWIANLPESGMSRAVAREAEMLAEIAAAEKALAAARRDLRAHRKAALAYVTANWTDAEIAVAKGAE